jgi:hypothetical protein
MEGWKREEKGGGRRAERGVGREKKGERRREREKEGERRGRAEKKVEEEREGLFRKGAREGERALRI